MQTKDVQLPIGKKLLANILKKAGAKQAFVFGSYARGEQTPESDLDLYVRFRSGVSLFDVFDVQAEIEKRSGVSVDLATKINPHFAEYVMPDMFEIKL